MTKFAVRSTDTVSADADEAITASTQDSALDAAMSAGEEQRHGSPAVRPDARFAAHFV